MKKLNLMLTSIVKSVFSGLKTFVRQVGEPGMIQQARVGRAMGVLEEHRKQQRLDTLKKEARHIRKGRRSA